MKSKKGEQPSYAEAMTRLEQIVARVERGEVDVDELAGSVKEAAALVRLCRERLRSAQADVEEALRELEGDPQPQRAAPDGTPKPDHAQSGPAANGAASPPQDAREAVFQIDIFAEE